MDHEYSNRKSLPLDRGRIYAGTRLFGRVQENRRGHFIATRFIHCLCVPIAPLESYLVLEDRGDRLAGVEIPRNQLSVFVAYLRGVSFLAVGSAFVFWVEVLEHTPLTAFPLPIRLLIWCWFALAALGILGLAFSYLSPRITKATPSTNQWIDEILNAINA